MIPKCVAVICLAVLLGTAVAPLASADVPIEVSPARLGAIVERRAMKSTFASLEVFAQQALRLSGHERLARLNHVATILVSQSEYAKFNHWNDELEQAARQDGDARYLALSELNRLEARAQDGDLSVLSLMRKVADTTKDWYVRLQAVSYIALNTDDAGAAIKALSDIETTVVPSDPDAASAYSIVWESTGLALKGVADLEAVTEALSRSEYYSDQIGYPRPDFDSIYNLTKLVTLVGDGATARQLVRAHHTLSLRSGLPHLMPWDMGLCALVAEKFGTPQETLDCLKDLSPAISDSELIGTGVLSARALALARVGRAAEAQADLDRLRMLKATGGYGEARFTSIPLIETEILAAKGQTAAALNGYRKYLLTSSWAQADLSRQGVHQITAQMREQLGAMRHNAELKQRMIYVQWGLGVLAVLIMAGGALVVAQQRRLNARLKRAQQHATAANRTKSEFLANMSHEIRTPLNGVLGMAEVIAAGELVPSQRERLEVVRQSGKALLAIINDILDLSKIEAGHLELEYLVFDFGKLVHDVAASFAPLSNEKRLELTVLIAPDAEGSVWGDPTRTRQILSNLISNAIKFTEEGGVTVRVERSGYILSVAVEDTGIGMAPEVANRIFNKFEQADGSVTRRFGGTGLGLSIARQLATAMGGGIDVSSTPGRGSSFVTRLAFRKVSQASEPDVTVKPQAYARQLPPGLRVLVAEDNVINQLVVRGMLERESCDVSFVFDGAEAVAAAKRQDWDIVLMDVQMPNMDGLDAARAIRAAEVADRRRRTPLIALTASAMDHQVKECLEAGMDAHVAKPIEALRLVSVMASVLKTQDATDARSAGATA